MGRSPRRGTGHLRGLHGLSIRRARKKKLEVQEGMKEYGQDEEGNSKIGIRFQSFHFCVIKNLFRLFRYLFHFLITFSTISISIQQHVYSATFSTFVYFYIS